MQILETVEKVSRPERSSVFPPAGCPRTLRAGEPHVCPLWSASLPGTRRAVFRVESSWLLRFLLQ